jgi:phospholipase/lecithinase/hemolysin
MNCSWSTTTADAVDAADAIFVFGDSYMDTGNLPGPNAPYGSSWPGYPANRWSDGRNQADYFGKEFPYSRSILSFFFTGVYVVTGHGHIDFKPTSEVHYFSFDYRAYFNRN